jgi:hypothetical protein
VLYGSKSKPSFHITNGGENKLISDRRILANNDYKTISTAAASWEINRLNQSNTKNRNIIPTMNEIDFIENENEESGIKLSCDEIAKLFQPQEGA